MYPDLSFFLKETFGIELLLPIKTFGLFMALSFLAAYMIMYRELKRKTSQGLFLTETTRIGVRKKLSLVDYILYILGGGFLGYKLGLVFTDYAAFASDPQAILFSAKGTWLGLLLGMIGFAALMYGDFSGKKAHEGKEITSGPHDIHLGNLTALAAIAGILGAKFFHNLENFQELMEDPIGALLSFSGLTFYGGLICAAGAIIYYARKHKIALIPLIDSFAPALMLAYGVGRIGCHLSGDGDWGIPNISEGPAWLPSWLWSYDYPHNVINAGELLPNATTDQYMRHLTPAVYPTPFYEAIACIGLFFVLWMFRKRIKTPGILFSIYLMMNGLERFLIERIRVNPDYHFLGLAASQATIISLLLFLTGVGLFFYFTRRNKANTETLHPSN